MVVGQVSTWLQANDWANGQTSPTQQAITEQAVANAALASAQANYYQGIASLAATAARRRCGRDHHQIGRCRSAAPTGSPPART
jgi:hypothetical protein